MADSELVFTTESPSITAAEIARRRQYEDMQAAAQRIRDRVDNDDA